MATKSCELDTIPTSVLKQITPSIVPTITRIINISLTQGIFAEEWKTTIVHPLLKKQESQLILSDYRSVSNLSFLSKLLEKCALQQFNKHCITNKLLPNYQSAYGKNYIMETSLIKLINDILGAMERQEVTALTALDLSATFDTVDHEILIEVLEHQFGITNSALSWFKTYLYPRKFIVDISGHRLREIDLKFSVPQGSLAGPILYLAYASTLRYVIQANSMININGYADDHSLNKNFSADNRNDETSTIRLLELCMTDIKDWMDSNRLKMNTTKTEFIMFGWKKQLQKCITETMKVNDDMVPRSNTVKCLGAWLDQHLSFKTHIKKKCQTAMMNLQKIKTIHHMLSQEACHQQILGLVMSHLDYVNAILINLPQREINKLQRIQNMAAKIVLCKSKYESSRESLWELHWLPIHRRIQHKIQMYEWAGTRLSHQSTTNASRQSITQIR